MKSEVAATVDARGKNCPVPIIELALAMRTAAAGAVVLLLGTDPALPEDLTAWCESTGHELTQLETLPGPFLRARIRKAR